MDIVLAIDAGTTSVRVVAVSPDGRIVGAAQREFPQYFPQPGWVEHDPGEIWSAFEVDPSMLPDVVPSSGVIGSWAGIPVAGIAGDQQAALFGNACIEPGTTKNTYGTGSFVLVNAGRVAPPPARAVLTTIAWDLGD